MRGGLRAAAGAVALAALGALAWWLTREAPAPPPPGRGPGAGAAAAGGEETAPAAPAAGPAAAKGAGAPGTASPGAADSGPVEGEVHEIRGIVIDGGGKPVPGAAVEARDAAMGLRNLDISFILRLASEESRPLARTTADDRGRFVLARVPAGTVLLRADAEGFSPGHAGPLSPALHPRSRSVEIVVGHGLPLEGRVFLASGTPLPGVRVRALPEPRDPTFLFQGSNAVTDGDGRFAFPSLLPGEYMLFLSPPGRAVRVVADLDVPADRPVEVSIPAGGALAVAVRGPGGAPVPGTVVVAINERQRGLFARGTTDAAGRVLLEGLDPGEIAVVASCPGFVPWAAQGRKGNPARPTVKENETTELAVDLEKGAVLRGRVLDAGTSGPVAGAVVRALGKGFDEILGGSSRAETGPDGAYRIEGLAEGRVKLLVQAEGYAPPGSLRPGAEDDAFTAEVPGPGAEVEKDLLLPRAATATGVVLRPDGTPAGGAEVRAEPEEGGGFEALFLAGAPEGYADAEGRFRLEGVPPGPALALVASLPGFVPGRAEGIQAKPGAALEGLEIRLGTGGSLAGTVKTGSGAPVPGAFVTFSPQGRPGPFRKGAAASVRTDEGGRFEARGLPPGSVVVAAALSGFVPASRGVEIAEGKAAEVEFVLEPSAVLAGTVADEEGSPVEDVHVSAKPSGSEGGDTRGASTGKDGRFEIREVVAGRSYDLSIRKDGYLPASREEVPAGTRDLPLVLPSGLAIAGRLLDEEGRGVADTNVSAQRKGSPGGWSRTDAQGAFEVRGLEAGRYGLRVAESPATAELVTEEMADVEAGTRGVVYRLRRGAAVAGRVLDEQGRPAPGVAVRARTKAGRSRSCVTGPDGEFRVPGLEGACSVTASGAGFLAAKRDDVAAGTADLEIRVRRGAALAGVVAGPDGAPVPGAMVKIRGEGATWEFPADDEGRFRRDGLEPGKEFQAGAWRTHERRPPDAVPESGWVAVRSGDEAIRLTVP